MITGVFKPANSLIKADSFLQKTSGPNLFSNFYSNVSFGAKKEDKDTVSLTKYKPEVFFLEPGLKKKNEIYKSFFESNNHSDCFFEISSNSKVYKVGKGPSSLIIKVKHKDSGIEKGVVKQISKDFDNEVRILSSLPKSFKNRLRLIGYSKLNDSVNTIATEFIDGKKLDANLHNLNKKVLSQLYSDLLILDEAGILHRDLTTYNILVDKNGIAKVVDYGASKTFEEMTALNETGQIKYKHPDFLAYSNIQNFEENALLVYLKQLENTDSLNLKEADKLFEEHLKLKADYYEKHVQIVFDKYKRNRNLKQKIENDLIYKDAYGLLKSKALNPQVKKDLMNIEKLRIKMNHAQKRVRLYNDNTLKNPVTGLYWNMLEGSYSKGLIKKSKEFMEKYKNNNILYAYFDLQNKIGKYHYKEIFLPEYNRHSAEVHDFLVKNGTKNLDTILLEGNLLEKKDADGNWCGPCVAIYKADIKTDNEDETYKF